MTTRQNIPTTVTSRPTNVTSNRPSTSINVANTGNNVANVGKVDQTLLQQSTSTILGISPLVELQSSDFLLDTDEKILLKYKDCLIIFFYSDDVISKQIARVFVEAANTVPGKKFAACNLRVNSAVADAFNALETQDSVMRAFRLKQVPFILTYRGGRPQAFYNGSISTQALVNYSFQLACKPGYVELSQLSSNMAVSDNLQVEAFKEDKTVYTNSTQFTTANAFSGFNPNVPITRVGSQAAVNEAAQLSNVAQQQAVGNLTPAQIQAGLTQPVKLPTLPQPMTQATPNLTGQPAPNLTGQPVPNLTGAATNPLSANNLVPTKASAVPTTGIRQ